MYIGSYAKPDLKVIGLFAHRVCTSTASIANRR